MIRLLFLPVLCASGLVLAVIAAGHAFARTGEATATRVLVTDRDPRQVAGVHRLQAWGTRPRVFQQAPMLDSRDLPPVADRLPADPLVVVPAESMGPYGGTWESFTTSLGEGLHVDVEWYANATGLVRWAPDASGMVADVAESFTAAPDARSITFRLRPGLRWSDGQPFTSADVRFWCDAIAANQEISDNVPAFLANRTGRIETPDPWTVRIVLDQPDSLLLATMGFEMWATDLCAAPRHYLERFLPGPRSAAELSAEAVTAGFASWPERFRNRWSWRNPDCPRLWAWVMKTPPPATTVVLERNPYYGKVDPDGRQLPYIDRVQFTLADPESVPIKVMRGDSALQSRSLRTLDYSMLLKHQRHGRYQVRHWLGTVPSTALTFNRSIRSPWLRPLLNDGRFVRALSLAIDRQELIDLFAFGIGRPRHPAPQEASPYADPALASRDTEHDPATTARLLDELGCRPGPDGMRRAGDGTPIRLMIEVVAPELVQVGQVVVQQWATVGIVAEIRLLARELYYARKGAGEQQCLLESAAGGELDPLLDARAYIPIAPESSWATCWAGWFRPGAERPGDEPPADIQATVADWRAIIASDDPAEHRRRFAAILARGAERRHSIGLFTGLPPWVVVRDDLRNVPAVGLTGWTYRSLGASAPECFALDPSRRSSP